jgi:hypothetical protein
MSRGNSWDRHSGTASFNDNSSIHTADDSVFSEPERRGHRSRPHSDVVNEPKLRSRNLPPRPTTQSFGRPHPSHIYDDDVDHRHHPSMTGRRSYSPPNDYPHVSHPYRDEHAYAPRPGLDRRASFQVPPPQAPLNNPFDAARYPPRPVRAMSYAAGIHEPEFAGRDTRYPPTRALQDSVHLDEIADALEQIRDSRRKPLGGFGRRVESEWDGRYERERGGYDGYERRRY